MKFINYKLIFRLITVWLALCLLAPGLSMAGTLQVAVASNFRDAIKPLVQRFEADTDYRVTLIFGSTGKQYAQIINGAPFDLFFAADSARPELLEQQGLAVKDSRFTYALGRLVLWSPQPELVDDQGEVLASSNFRHLAIANPKLAPYGLAAQQVMQALGLLDLLSPRLVRGENIAQVFGFVKSANAELGFVAWSQISRPGDFVDGSFWNVPQDLYAPIEQQAVLLKDSPAAREFLALVRSAAGAGIIREHGYGLPDE